MNKHLGKNIAHPERIFTQTLEFSYDAAFNQILYAALLALQELPLRAPLADQLQQLCRLFPPVKPWNLPLPELEILRFNRGTLRYKNVLQTALLILKQLQPDVRSGQLPVLAILFDMNFLFEEFIFRQLQKLNNKNIIIKRQVPKPFWNRRPIQPDILLTIDNQNIVIDTKWKKLQKVSPTMEDLRQMYVYNQYFEAKHSVLVYPRMPGLEDLEPVPFHAKENLETYFCEVRLVDLVKNAQLNRSLGLDLLEKLSKKNL
jgi:5-methylcytosine-specific restriction enzyme subunit McrC